MDSVNTDNRDSCCKELAGQQVTECVVSRLVARRRCFLVFGQDGSLFASCLNFSLEAGEFMDPVFPELQEVYNFAALVIGKNMLVGMSGYMGKLFE